MSWVIAGMAAAGLAKSEFIDAPKAERQRKLQGEIARYSPWTGMKPTPVKEADPFGSALEFGGTGAAMSHNMKLDDAQSKYYNAAAGSFDRGGGLTGGGGPASAENAMAPMTESSINNAYSPESKPFFASPDGSVPGTTRAGQSKSNPVFPGLKLQSSWWNTGDGQ